MLYDIKLALKYKYKPAALGGRHILRLMPADIAGEQRLVAGFLEISPRADERVDSVDFFGTQTTFSACGGPHPALNFTLSARVNRLAIIPSFDMSPPLRSLNDDIQHYKAIDARSPHHFLGVSPLVAVNADIAAYARDVVSAQMSSQEAVSAISLALHRDMKFDPDATEVDTPMQEAFENRHGVCQDFSHIMICCLRSLGIPSGYVSGFLRTVPPPGKPRLEGADAMHAWVQAWCGFEAGWVEFDPTNATLVGQDHIVIGRGRDYSDVAPIKGIFRAAGSQDTSQAVDVIPLA